MKPLKKSSVIIVIVFVIHTISLIRINHDLQAAQVTENKLEPDADPVKIGEDDSSFTISNGIITAKISKRNGDMTSLIYKGTETLTDKSGHAGAYWSHDTTGGINTVTKITIDPKSNGGRRGEVSVKGISGGRKMGHGPGAAPDGDFPADVEIRYNMGRDESGLYTYCIFEHLPEYLAAIMTEARFCAKLASFFDWISIDEKRNKYYPQEVPGEDKYVYTAIQSENRAYGFSSTTQKIGWWIVNPTIEYLSGGPTKPEFLCHRDTTQVQAPCVLNYWRSSHYGGANVSVAEGEHWIKVIGPFFMYINTGDDSIAMWKDALAQAEKENAKWPYSWVAGVDYPTRKERSDVNGQIVLNDPLMQGGAKFAGKLMVGLTHEAYSVPARQNRTLQINWQTDAKYYQFWTRGDNRTGRFSIPNVRPGTYALYAFADGVLGELVKTEIKIEPGGKPIDLGKLEWTPVRHGRQLWDIGIANRNASEFMNGDKYFEPDVQLQYPMFFPNDVNFVIGKSDFSKDWYFQHIPHNTDQNARISPFRGVTGTGRATPYAITFELPDAPSGTATLRLAICGTGTRKIDVTVNSQTVGQVQLALPDGIITRHQIQGIWYEQELAFDASLMKQGTNILILTVPAGPINNGVVYDYLRLELNKSKNI
jgi:rhamnogalacturonan endolyase